MSDRKAVIKNADMSEEMQQEAIDCATQALEKFVYLIFPVLLHTTFPISRYNIEKDIAAYIKKVCVRFAKKWGKSTKISV